ncbi:MAG: site-2 protease family protein [Leptospira sp.]|nr:site-2 protease family protein [Leptospira sp.]
MRNEKTRLNVMLFFITFLTMTFREDLFLGLIFWDWNALWSIFKMEWSYSLSLILILLCHEMGHYLPARFYGIRATLPYFIPFPIGPIGTMGAVIKIQEPIPDKIKLFDIGIGGPIMSLVLSVPAWIGGLYLSKLIPIDDTLSYENLLFFGDSLFTYWSGQWVMGPYDTALYDIQIHPLAKAGWVGLIITAINLLPFGQLDGGHVIYALFGEKYRNWIHYLFIGFLVLALWNFTWLVWGFLIYYFIKIEHPYVPDNHREELGPGRRFLGWFMLLSLLFIFVPSPISLGIDKGSTNLLEDIINYLF